MRKKELFDTVAQNIVNSGATIERKIADLSARYLSLDMDLGAESDEVSKNYIRDCMEQIDRELEQLKKKFEGFHKAFNDFMDCEPEKRVWLAGDFDFSFPGKEAEFIPELNETSDISEAFYNGEEFSVPFVTAEILKMSLGTGNDFWLGNVKVCPVTASNNIEDFGFEVFDWNGKVINEYYFSDYYQTEIDLLIEGVDFEHLAEDINAYMEGYNS